ncbi:MAG: tol-pal system protein YbgF [Gammaproteobacteria bacterium]|nr:tol-pal system protein YbgF [Gammaproteobacteria bacterium]MCY4219350.1 tol-pal system protein YbgF [Gammaproteobacteria bacterium]
MTSHMIAVIRINKAWRKLANRQANFFLVISCSLLGLGLVPVVTAQTVVDQTAVQESSPSEQLSSQSTATYELLHILNQLNEIKAELKLLRNSVEEMEFENQKTQRRQSDLFLDIDRRLTELESIPIADLQIASKLQGGEQTIDAGGFGAEASQVLVVPDGSMPSGQTETSSTGETERTTPNTVTESTNDQSIGINVVSIQEQDLYDQAIEQLKQSRYEEAINGFQQLADTWPASQLADNAYFWLSEALYLNREFEKALAGFKVITDNYPDSDRLPDAMLKIGYIYYDVGEYTNAADTFRSVLERFPNHQVSVSAQTRLRRIEQSIQ